jgi:hypothetical protein
MKRVNIILIVVMLGFISCVKPYVPRVDKYEDLLVVDGGISDQPGPYYIYLSKSTKVQQYSVWIAYPRCEVQIKDDAGNVYSFKETVPGVYESDSATFTGVPGRRYQLQVTTETGEQIESTADELLQGVKIKSIEAQLEHKDGKHFFWGRDGYQFYVSTEPSPFDENYLLWRLDYTYKFQVDFGAAEYFDGKLHIIQWGDTVRTCFSTKNVQEIFLMNMNELNTKQITHHPLYYEDNYTKALTMRYSLNVAQYRLMEPAFKYWSEMKKLIDNSGSIYSVQPYQVKNNLKNVTDPERPVVGYFTVAGVSQKRIFLNKPPIVFRLDSCHVDVRPVNQGPIRAAIAKRPDLWPVFYADTKYGPYYLDQYCVNCLKLGTQVRPKYWID